MTWGVNGEHSSLLIMDRIVTEEGKTKEEAIFKLKANYPNSNQQIILEREIRNGWKFWSKSWEIKAFIQEAKQDEINVKQQVKKNVKSKKTDNAKANELIEMLTLNKESGSNDDDIKQLLKTIDNLLQKFDTDNRKKPLPLPLEKMETYLVDQELDSRQARIYVEKVEEQFKNTAVIQETEVNDSIRSLIESQINVMGPLDCNKKKIIALVGPTGVGKTTTLAKIGWELISKKRTVGFITTDTFRSGAKEQLENYAQTMDSEIKVARSAKELKEAIQYFENVNKVDHILIDTVGRNPLEEKSIDSVVEYLETATPTNKESMLTCLVLSSTSKVRDIQETVNRFKKADIESLIFTKLDETYNVGSVLNTFNFTKIPLLFVTDGQDITKNIYAPSKRVLANKILSKETQYEGEVLLQSTL